MKKLIVLFTIILISISSLVNAQQYTLDTLHAGFIKDRVGFGGVAEGVVKKGVILNGQKLKFINNALDSVLTVSAFELTIFVKGKKPVLFVNSVNGELSDEMKAAILSAPIGTKAYFEYIKCKDKNGQTFSLFASAYTLD